MEEQPHGIGKPKSSLTILSLIGLNRDFTGVGRAGGLCASGSRRQRRQPAVRSGHWAKFLTPTWTFSQPQCTTANAKKDGKALQIWLNVPVQLKLYWLPHMCIERDIVPPLTATNKLFNVHMSMRVLWYDWLEKCEPILSHYQFYKASNKVQTVTVVEQQWSCMSEPADCSVQLARVNMLEWWSERNSQISISVASHQYRCNANPRREKECCLIKNQQEIHLSACEPK